MSKRKRTQLSPVATHGPCFPRPTLLASADESGPLAGHVDRQHVLRWHRPGSEAPLGVVDTNRRLLRVAAGAPRMVDAFSAALRNLQDEPLHDLPGAGTCRPSAISYDGRFVLGVEQSAWMLWGPEGGVEASGSLPGRSNYHGSAIDAHAERFATILEDGVVLFDRTGASARCEGELEVARGLVASPDGSMFGCRDKRGAWLWSFADGRLLARIEVRKPEGIALLPDMVLMAQWTKTLAFATTGEPLGVLPIRAAAIAALGNGDQLWSGGANADLSVWDTRACRALLEGTA